MQSPKIPWKTLNAFFFQTIILEPFTIFETLFSASSSHWQIAMESKLYYFTRTKIGL